MDPLNLRILINATGATGDRLVQSIAAIRNTPYKDRMAMFTNINFNNVDAGFPQRIVQQLEADAKNGALGVGEIMKNFGLRARKADGIAPAHRRSDARSDLGGVCPAEPGRS